MVSRCRRVVDHPTGDPPGRPPSSIHTRAQITGKAASMGEGVMVGVLDGLITDFTTKLGQV